MMFSEPAWQAGPGVANSYSNAMRQVPDVSLDADPRTGYSIYATDKGTTGWFDVGGTSAAAPVWAAFTGILNQFRASYDLRPLGFGNPTLYRLGSTAQRYPPFHDVVTGDNLKYQASIGWDYATGWGSFDAYNLAQDVDGNRLQARPVQGPTAFPNRIAPPAVPRSGSTSRSPTTPSSVSPAAAPLPMPAIQTVFDGLRQLVRLLGVS